MIRRELPLTVIASPVDRRTTRFVNAAYLNERYKPLEPAGKIRTGTYQLTIIEFRPQYLITFGTWPTRL
jgi:hypothetical protein